VDRIDEKKKGKTRERISTTPSSTCSRGRKKKGRKGGKLLFPIRCRPEGGPGPFSTGIPQPMPILGEKGGERRPEPVLDCQEGEIEEVRTTPVPTRQ